MVDLPDVLLLERSLFGYVDSESNHFGDLSDDELVEVL